MRTRFRPPAAAAVAAAFALLCCARPASAQVQLVVVSPTTSGVTASTGPIVFSPDSATPTQATVTNEDASASQTATATLDDTPDAVRQFTFNAALTVPQTNASNAYQVFAGTGTSTNPFSLITFQVVGTGGYTGPVTVSLTSVYQVSTSGTGASSNSRVTQQVNGQNVAVPVGASGPTLFTFNVGDTFTYRAEVLGFVAASSTQTGFTTQQLTTTLTASAATPAPPGLVVAGIGGLMGLASFRRRRRKAAA